MSEQRILTEHEQLVRDLVVERFRLPPDRRKLTNAHSTEVVDTGERAPREDQSRSASQPNVGRSRR
jgi:hypothetical protein